MDELERYIQLAREGHAPEHSPADRLAERNHRNYLRLKAKDPDYYTRRRREERRRKREERNTQ